MWGLGRDWGGGGVGSAEYARAAISSIIAPFSGSPFTYQRPFSHARSSGVVSSIVAAIRRALSRTLRETTATAPPETGVERLPYVPSPYGDLSVSPWRTSTSSGGIPSSSATICANVVSWP